MAFFGPLRRLESGAPWRCRFFKRCIPADSASPSLPPRNEVIVRPEHAVRVLLASPTLSSDRIRAGAEVKAVEIDDGRSGAPAAHGRDGGKITVPLRAGLPRKTGPLGTDASAETTR